MLKSKLKFIYNLFCKFGLDLRRVLSFAKFPKYARQYFDFIKKGGVVTRFDAVLYDYSEQAGVGSGHYFHQDLLIASYVHKNNPLRHIDVGSRIDGFVAHVASFRKIEVLDIRELRSIGHPNIKFIQSDLMEEKNEYANIADSISCLHAIEHFGLGRYGDSIDPNGHIIGFNNILKMLKVGGLLYISYPIGVKSEVHFNAQRIFSVNEIFSWPNDGAKMELVNFDYVDQFGILHRNRNINDPSLKPDNGCGIFTLKKLSAEQSRYITIPIK